MSAPKDEGWALPTATARKYHYFVDGRSLCGGWAYLGSSWFICIAQTDKCKACARKLS